MTFIHVVIFSHRLQNITWRQTATFFLLFLNVSETHQSSSCNVSIVFKHRRELREWAWRHSAMFAEKTQYMFLMLCGQWIKRRWFWWAHKNHYSTQNYKIQGCKILFITNSIWRRSRWGWGWEVPDKKVETFFFGELHFLIEIYSRILAFPVTIKIDINVKDEISVRENLRFLFV